MPQLSPDVLALIIQHAANEAERSFEPPHPLPRWQQRATLLRRLLLVSRVWRALAQAELDRYLAVTQYNCEVVRRALNARGFDNRVKRVLLDRQHRSPHDPRQVDSVLERCETVEELERIGAKWVMFRLKRASNAPARLSRDAG